MIRPKPGSNATSEKRLFWFSVIFTLALLFLGAWKAAELISGLFLAILGGA